MANERTLLERLMYPEQQPGRSARERKEHLADSVIKHLTRLLNARQGCNLIAPDYGMPDFNENLGTKNEITVTFETAIRNTILKYEPRLRRVNVRLESDEGPRLTPRFLITAELVTTEAGDKTITFATVMDPQGRISIN